MPRLWVRASFETEQVSKTIHENTRSKSFFVSVRVNSWIGLFYGRQSFGPGGDQMFIEPNTLKNFEAPQGAKCFSFAERHIALLGAKTFFPQ